MSGFRWAPPPPPDRIIRRGRPAFNGNGDSPEPEAVTLHVEPDGDDVDGQEPTTKEEK